MLSMVNEATSLDYLVVVLVIEFVLLLRVALKTLFLNLLVAHIKLAKPLWDEPRREIQLLFLLC
jgi:hypothetical protein